MNNTELKIRMMQDEMAEAFLQANPGYFATKSAVGRFARKIGYQRVKQTLNGKQVYFYIKIQSND